PERYFHFPSRTAGHESPANLTELVDEWLRATFGIAAAAWIAPRPEPLPDCSGPFAAVSLGVGENDSKRVGGEFEARLIGVLGSHFGAVVLDRGVGGEEARRVTA